MMRNSLLRSITANPWTSIHDALLGVSVLCVAGLLAIELDLFRFGEVLTAEERRISLAEAIARRHPGYFADVDAADRAA